MQRLSLKSVALVWLLALFAFAPMVTAQQAATEANQTSLDFMAAAQDPDTPYDDLEIILIPLTKDELATVAEGWQALVHDKLEDIAARNLKLRSGSDADKEKLREVLVALQEDLVQDLESYELVLTSWAGKGGTAEEIQTHRDYIKALKSGVLSTSDIRTLVMNALDWLVSKDGGLGVLAAVLGLLIAIWVMMFAARFVRKMTERGLARVPTLSRLLKKFIVGAVYWVVFGLGILLVLGLFGVNVTPLFAVFGGLSFILGFALQETLGNLASGLMIMVLKPFDTGDYIHVAGTDGTVDEMSVVSTRIRTFDNQVITVPNSKIWGDVITNVSASAERRVDLVFGIGYSDNAAHAISVLTALVKAHPMCLDLPATEIFVGELGDSSVNIYCRPWVKTGDYWTVYWDITGQAKEAFDAEGISIPFPQRDVHLYQASPSPALPET